MKNLIVIGERKIGQFVKQELDEVSYTTIWERTLISIPLEFCVSYE